MGMYTGLRAKIQVAPDFIPVIHRFGDLWWKSDDPEVIAKRDPEHHGNTWGDVALEFPQFPFIGEWAKHTRADFIPRGGLTGVWDEDPAWEETVTDDGVWTFQCELKNYGGEIQKFADLVLAEIMERKFVLIWQHEEGDGPCELTVPCLHNAGYWIQKGETFRCYGCGYQLALADLPDRKRDIEVWRP